MDENLQESIKEIIIASAAIVGTLTIYHLLAIYTNTLALFFMHLPYSLRPPFVLLSPGVLAAIIYGLLYKNPAKMVAVVIITIFIWISWFFAIYPALTLE
ncbi:hypothetical protein V7O67_05240 [Methanolobus sp. ZRKC4]|uniref:hypothetical protein n=1 Tax=Methanolobus sp. ZRKC4 TaxID=3125787 RepID=UPI003246C1E4